MVHRCILCYSASNIHKDVSFHQFPKDETRRSIWIDALSIKEVVMDWHRICSLHFSLDHFTFSNEEKILKLDAIPIMKEVKDKVESCETSLEHDTSNSLIDVDSCTENNDIDIQIVTHKDSTNESPPSTSKRYNQLLSLDFGHKKKKYMSSSRIGDLDKDNFSTPKRRKRNLTTIKNTVTNLMNKNKLLTQKNVRLRKKVDSLNNIVKELIYKRLISENATINLEVKYKYRNIVGSMHGNCGILDSTKTLSVTSMLTNDKSEKEQIILLKIKTMSILAQLYI
ncbi:hypothetical protein QTP88_028561 [Uroleucon formosanum]